MTKFLVNNEDNSLINIDHISHIFIQETDLNDDERFQIKAETESFTFVITTSSDEEVIKNRFWALYNMLNSSKTPK
jgi:hypothetical protein